MRLMGVTLHGKLIGWTSVICVTSVRTVNPPMQAGSVRDNFNDGRVRRVDEIRRPKIAFVQMVENFLVDWIIGRVCVLFHVIVLSGGSSRRAYIMAIGFVIRLDRTSCACRALGRARAVLWYTMICPFCPSNPTIDVAQTLEPRLSRRRYGNVSLCSGEHNSFSCAQN